MPHCQLGSSWPYWTQCKCSEFKRWWRNTHRPPDVLSSTDSLNPICDVENGLLLCGKIFCVSSHVNLVLDSQFPVRMDQMMAEVFVTDTATFDASALMLSEMFDAFSSSFFLFFLPPPPPLSRRFSSQNNHYSSSCENRAIQHRNPRCSERTSRFRDDEFESSANFNGANYYRSQGDKCFLRAAFPRSPVSRQAIFPLSR